MNSALSLGQLTDMTLFIDYSGRLWGHPIFLSARSLCCFPKAALLVFFYACMHTHVHRHTDQVARQNKPRINSDQMRMRSLVSGQTFDLYCFRIVSYRKLYLVGKITFACPLNPVYRPLFLGLVPPRNIAGQVENHDVYC